MYYESEREKEELSGSPYPGFEVQIARECIVCGNEMIIYGGHVSTDGSDLICSDCKKAILWAKEKMKEEGGKEKKE